MLFISFLTHGSLSFVFYFFSSFYFLMNCKFLKDNNLKNIVTNISVIISGPLIFSKAIGYADQNMKDAEIIYSNETILKQLLERKKS